MAKAGSPTGGKIPITQLAHGAFSNGTSIDIRRLDGYDYARFDGVIRNYRTYWYQGKKIHEYTIDFDNSPAWDRYIHSKPLYKDGTHVKKGQRIGKADPDYYPEHLHLDYNNGKDFENPLNVTDRRTGIELASGYTWKASSKKYGTWAGYPDHQIPITNPDMTFRLYKEGNDIKFQITSGSYKGYATVYRRNAGSRNGTKFQVSLVTGPKSGVMVKGADQITYEVHIGSVVQTFDNRNLPQEDPKDKKIAELEGEIKRLGDLVEKKETALTACQTKRGEDELKYTELETKYNNQGISLKTAIAQKEVLEEKLNDGLFKNIGEFISKVIFRKK